MAKKKPLDDATRKELRTRKKSASNQHPDTEMLGRFILEDGDGRALATVLYAAPANTRPFAFLAELGNFEQVRQTVSGQWVYRKSQELCGRGVDSRLVEYRFPDDANWDGPPPLFIPDALPLSQRAEVEKAIAALSIIKE